jgi:hypothetical protein
MALIEVEVRVYCTCGKELEIDETRYGNDEYTVHVNRCLDCTNEEYDRAYDNGYDAGRTDDRSDAIWAS